MFVISRCGNFEGHRISFVMSRTSLNRGSLNRGSTVANVACHTHSTYITNTTYNANKTYNTNSAYNLFVSFSWRFIVFLFPAFTNLSLLHFSRPKSPRLNPQPRFHRPWERGCSVLRSVTKILLLLVKFRLLKTVKVCRCCNQIVCSDFRQWRGLVQETSVELEKILVQ